MKSTHWNLLTALAICLLSSCFRKDPPLITTGGGPGIGPFDSRGYYREEWADDPSKWRRPTTSTAVASNNTPARPTTSDLPPARSNPTSAGPSSAGSGPSTASLPRPKPQPSATRYTVKRGDTLSAIAKRNRTTVAAIQRANGISGAMIHPGQRLVIPRR